MTTFAIGGTVELRDSLGAVARFRMSNVSIEATFVPPESSFIAALREAIPGDTISLVDLPPLVYRLTNVNFGRRPLYGLGTFGRTAQQRRKNRTRLLQRLRRRDGGAYVAKGSDER